MFRIDAADNVGNMFDDGDPATGRQGTVVSDEWLNAVQEEICAVITGMGLTLEKANSAQLFAAFLAILARANTWTAAQTFNAAVNVPTPTAAGHAARRDYVDAADSAEASTRSNADALKANLSGANFTGAVTVQAPTAASNPARKTDLDNFVAATANIGNGAVTRAKLAAVGQQVSSSCGAYISNNTSWTDVTNLSISITTTGRPVIVFLRSDGSGNGSGLTGYAASATVLISQYRIQRDSTVVNASELQIQVPGSAGQLAIDLPAGVLFTFDVPSAGTYTYKVQAKSYDAGTSTRVNYCQLVAFEL